MDNKNPAMTGPIREICTEAAAPWRERITASIPGARGSAASGGIDCFRNVRGFIINETIDRVLAGIAENCGRDRMKAAMVTWMKLQALETESPEEAVDFLRQLKSIVHENAPGSGARADAARTVEASIDEWIDVASELYRETRSLLPDLMLREKRRTEIRTLKKDRNREVPR